MTDSTSCVEDGSRVSSDEGIADTMIDVVAVTSDTPELGDTPLIQSVLPEESTV